MTTPAIIAFLRSIPLLPHRSGRRPARILRFEACCSVVQKGVIVCHSNGVDSKMDSRNMSRLYLGGLSVAHSGTTRLFSETRSGPSRWHRLTITDTDMSALADDGSSGLRNRGFSMDGSNPVGRTFFSGVTRTSCPKTTQAGQHRMLSTP